MASHLLACLLAVGVAMTFAQSETGYTREELESLTKFRQQHRLAHPVPRSASVVVVGLVAARKAVKLGDVLQAYA